MAVTSKRKSAEERREAVLDAGLVEFAEHGLHGASTERIAAQAGRLLSAAAPAMRRAGLTAVVDVDPQGF